MLRRVIIFGLFILVFSLVLPSVLAQECDAASISSHLADFSTQAKGSTHVSDVLDEIGSWLAEQQAACTAAMVDAPAQPTQTSTPEPSAPVISFSNQQSGDKRLFGPFDIPDGIYRARLETDGYFIASLETRKGSCEITPLSSDSQLFTISQGQASNGAEVLVEAKGCQAMLSLSGITDDWTLNFYLYDSSSALPAQAEYSSETSGISPVIGPIHFEDGAYTMVVTTDNAFLADIRSLEGDCSPDHWDNVMLMLQNQHLGDEQTFQEPFTAKNCIALITVTSASDWTLSFEPK